MNQCAQCTSSFEITNKDRKFYKTLDLPDPSMCPDCRNQRRISFRNFFNLYHRKCDLTGKQIISMYDVDSPCTVYDMHEWWSDKWDPLNYGFDFDFKHPVFDQLKVLHEEVPRMNIMNTQCENTDYCVFSFHSKDCYLVFGNVENENCYYGHIVWHSKNCFDCLYTYRSEYCYECVDCVESYGLSFSQNCDNCSESKFLVNCQGSRNCFGCVGLNNKEYHIFNKPYSKADYESKMKEFNSGNYKLIAIAKQEVDKLIGNEVVKHYHGYNSENITGDYLYNCKNVFDSYDAKNCEDSRFLATAESFNNSYDCNYSPALSEWCYNCCTVYGQSLLMCHAVNNNSANLSYCDNCYGCKDCFGCCGLKYKKYCIFNKQYTRENYETLKTKIIECMKKTGEWGEFFPASFSPFAYNETMANEYHPLDHNQAESLGYTWKNLNSDNGYKGPIYQIPDDIKDVPDTICKEILVCEVARKPYKIIPQELKFYHDHNLPIPHICWEERHKKRMKLRNPRKLVNRTCEKCSTPFQTTYSPERPEKVYCEQCYLKHVL